MRSTSFLAAFFLLAGALPSFAQETGRAVTEAAGTPVVYAVTLDGDMINAATEDYIVRALEEAVENKADAFLLRIDTPGGMLTSTRTIVKAMLASELPILTYVRPSGAHAGSAGVFITMAGHVAAMAPGTNIGAAHPVSGQGGDIEESGGKDLAKKVVSDTRAFVESIAKERGRNAEWAARAVTESVSITADRAVELNVVDFIAESDEALLRQADGMTVTVDGEEVALKIAGAKIQEVEMSWRQIFVNKLADPNIAYLLMTLGFLGIYFELSNPGMIFPGVIGGLSLMLAFVALQVLPFNVAGLGLILLALILFVLEAFVTSFGLLTIGGVVAMAAGGLLLFDTPEMTMSVDWSVLISVSLLMGLGALGISYLVARALRSKVQTGVEGMIGKVGKATSDLTPRGSVFVNGEIWTAIADQNVEKGTDVEVTGIEGLVLNVKVHGGGAPQTETIQGDE